MKQARHQKGYIFRKGGNWYLRYREFVVQPDGSSKLVQSCRKLVSYGVHYRSKKAVKVIADEFLGPINSGNTAPESTMSLTQFVVSRYLPFIEGHKRRSTYRGYLNMWKRYLEPHGQVPLRDFRTVDGEAVLFTIAQQQDLTCTTMAHIKAFLSGVFRYAKRQGVINSENPMRDVVLPPSKPRGETYAYSLEEITRMLSVLPESAATIVALAAYTGVRKGELAALRWEDYREEQIAVRQSVWRGHFSAPKTERSVGIVPVIAQLKKQLDDYKAVSGLEAGLIFQNTKGGPVSLDNLAWGVIRPALRRHGLEWHGWHAFRRGLATNLHRLGVSDLTIQRILRHSNVAVTQACYIKTFDKQAIDAMRQLECATSVQLAANNSATIQ